MDKTSLQNLIILIEQSEPKLKDCFRELTEIISDMKMRNERKLRAKICANVYGIVGGTATVAGLALAPFTCGVSTSLAIVGATVSGTGGIGDVAVSGIVGFADHNSVKEADVVIKRAYGYLDDLNKAYEKIYHDLKYMHKSIEKGYDFGIDQNSFYKVKKFKDIKSLINALDILAESPSLRTFAKRACQGSGDSFIVEAIGKTAPVAMSKGARIAAGAATGAFVLWDAWSLKDNLEKVQKGEITDAVKEIDDVRNDLESIFLEFKEKADILKRLINYK